MARTVLNPWTSSCSLLLLLCLHRASGMSGWAGCLDGQDVFATIKENSLFGEVVTEMAADTAMEGVRWSLEGKDAHWFFFDERNIRLNASADKILDREALGPVLMAELSCHEEDIQQTVYRVMVEIINENDNSPVFAENTARSLIISELTPVDTVVFTVQATDADNDKILYSIDQASPDAEYFKFDLPNSGEVILSKPLDYETKTLLTVTIFASEMDTAEHYNTSTNITISVLDGDDQYPQFVPCILLFRDETSRICTSPVYMVNVTEGEEDIVLDFSPGPIHAVDGDKEISSPLSYAILSGDDNGHFTMDRKTGVMRLTQGVRERLVTPVLHLQVMAYQDDDPRKYSVATVLVRVLAANLFNPQFDMNEYHGFVTAGQNAASLVNTYGTKALMLHVHDQDFKQGFNPRIIYAFSPTSNHTDIYQVTPGGFLIAKTNQLKPNQKHVLKVSAVDQESGDATFATVVVEVLPEGCPIPHSPAGDRLTGCTVGKALFMSMVFMTLLGCFLSLLMWLKKKQKTMRDPLQRGCVAQGKHPNVSLRWFQLVSHSSAMPHTEEVAYKNKECGTCNPSFSFQDQSDAIQDTPISQECMLAVSDASLILTEIACVPVNFNNKASTPTKTSCGSATFHPAEEGGDKDADPPKENPGPPPGTTADHTNDTSPAPAVHHGTRHSPLTAPDSQSASTDNPVQPVTGPSSPPSSSCNRIQTATAEMDNPLKETHDKTPSHSPSQSSLLHKGPDASPPTPEHGPLKATLVHIDTPTPTDTPPETPGQTAETMSLEAEEPSTSLDQIDPSDPADGTADAGSPSEGRRSSTNSGPTQVICRVGGEDDDGFLGDEDADKNSDGESELESDEEELLRVMARCNPIFITFRK
ncbi:protein dachsous [Cololabis saira]|uniref:protein dachsous n=1 Tax=Cololabis saira TaxID=129043 RepID=UPI002AD3C917|nr:protein dachsous [Cololabis saira]